MKYMSHFWFSRKIQVFTFLTLLVSNPAHADDVIWRKAAIEERKELIQILNSYETVAVLKYNSKEGQKVVELLKGKWKNEAVVTEELYQGFQNIFEQSGDYYCLYFGGIQRDGDRAVQIRSRILNLDWNKKPERIGVRSITGAKPSNGQFKGIELYITLDDIKKYYINHTFKGTDKM